MHLATFLAHAAIASALLAAWGAAVILVATRVMTHLDLRRHARRRR